MLQSKIKGVFFDLFGTLLIYDDLNKAWDAWYNEFYKGILKANPGIENERFSELCKGFFTRQESEKEYKYFTIYETRIIDFCNDNNLLYTSSTIRQIADNTVNAWQKFVLKDEVVEELLQSIRKTKITALISNFDHPRHIYKKLDEFGWNNLFDKIVVSGDAGVKKPDKRIFDIVLDEFGLMPEETVFVGDSKEDMDGAINAGIKPLLISRNGDSNSQQYDYNMPNSESDLHRMDGITIIKSLNEILNYI